MRVDYTVSVERLERSTNGLKGHCSTFELHARFLRKTFYHARFSSTSLDFSPRSRYYPSSNFNRVKELLMTDIPKLNETVFESEVLQSTLPVMVDFTAIWCGPCRMLDPVIAQLSQDWTGKVKIVKLDVDDNSSLAVKYGVMGVPTLILFINGNPVQRLTGYQPKDRIVSKFGSYI